MSDGPLSRLTRAVLLAAVAVVLVGLVAVAASGHGIGGSGSSEPTPYAVDTILTILFGLFALASIVLLVGVFWVGLAVRQDRELAAARRARYAPSLVVTGLVFAVLLFVLLRLGGDRRNGPRLPPIPTATSKQPAGERSSKEHDPQFQWPAFVAVFATAGVAVAAFYVAEKRRKQRLPSVPFAPEMLVDVLDETLADLRTERDPRRAVIGAYVRMERVLAAHGIPRERSEAPHEYLGRVLSELTHGGRGAKRLTALFERARFSTHDVDKKMQVEAIEAVEELQDELLALDAEKEHAA